MQLQQEQDQALLSKAIFLQQTLLGQIAYILLDILEDFIFGEAGSSSFLPLSVSDFANNTIDLSEESKRDGLLQRRLSQVSCCSRRSLKQINTSAGLGMSQLMASLRSKRALRLTCTPGLSCIAKPRLLYLCKNTCKCSISSPPMAGPLL